MPFLGTTTLADILTDLRRRPALPDSGRYLLDRIEAGTRERMETLGMSARRARHRPRPPNPAPPWRA